MSPKRVVLAGGGTGGHAYPAISVGQALRAADPRTELLFVGSSQGPEGELASAAGIAFESVPSAPLVGSKRIAALVRLVSGVFRARRILNRFGADVVFATGGHAAAAVVIAQWTRRGRIVIHEQNAVPGRTNLWLARFAERVCAATQSAAECFPAGNAVVTGMPIRSDFEALPGRSDARRALGLEDDLFTILVVGGSQGAKRINELMFEAWPRVTDGHTQVLHQVGRLNMDAMRHHASSHYRVQPTVEMPPALAGADLVVSRAGASTLAEITAAGVPAVLIPYPFAFADHQRLNAEELEKRGAAIVRIEKDLTADALADLMLDLRSSPGRLREMAEASRSCAIPDAAARVAEVVLGES